MSVKTTKGAEGGGVLLRGSEKNGGTSLTSLQLAFTEYAVPAIHVFDWSLDNKINVNLR